MLSLGYGNREVIHGVNISIPEGKTVGIIGPNGCGKSTLLKAFAGCLKPSGGIIKYDGMDIRSINHKNLAKKIAYIPQMLDIKIDIPVQQLISYGRYPYGNWMGRLSKKDRDIIDWAAKSTGIKDMLDRPISSLSGGERQRAYIAMAIAKEPQVIILDEPTTFLDICYQLEILELLKKLNTNFHNTVIMVLHDINQAMRYCDIIYVVNDGNIFDFGPPARVIDECMLRRVFGIEAYICHNGQYEFPYIIPNGFKKGDS